MLKPIPVSAGGDYGNAASEQSRIQRIRSGAEEGERRSVNNREDIDEVARVRAGQKIHDGGDARDNRQVRCEETDAQGDGHQHDKRAEQKD